MARQKLQKGAPTKAYLIHLLFAPSNGRLRMSQFGFREKRSTEEAIFVARRRIELAVAQRSGSVSLLALDWKKVLDCVSVASLIESLERFCILFLQCSGFHHEQSGFLRERVWYTVRPKTTVLRHIARLHLKSLAFRHRNVRCDARGSGHVVRERPCRLQRR